MKKALLTIVLFTTIISFSQTQSATTEDDRKVILKQDNTWSYAKTRKTKVPCTIKKGFKEPKWKKKQLLEKNGDKSR